MGLINIFETLLRKKSVENLFGFYLMSNKIKILDNIIKLWALSKKT